MGNAFKNKLPHWVGLVYALYFCYCQNKMQVDQEDQKHQAGDKEEKKSETEEMEVNEAMLVGMVSQQRNMPIFKSLSSTYSFTP